MQMGRLQEAQLWVNGRRRNQQSEAEGAAEEKTQNEGLSRPKGRQAADPRSNMTTAASLGSARGVAALVVYVFFHFSN